MRQLVQRPPWAIVFDGGPPLTLAAPLGGTASIRFDDEPGDSGVVLLDPGDLMLIKGSRRYTVADDPATQPHVMVRGHEKIFFGSGDEIERAKELLAPRTFGEGGPGATTMLRGLYSLRGDAGGRLLELLPPWAVIPAGPRTQGVLDLLTTEAARDEPGQDAVLHRLLDLVLVLALRAWCARPGAELPAWFRALADPAVGDALRLLHTEPAHPWTVAGLAAAVGMSRATFAARFAGLVGEPPLAYLTNWRMALGADLLRDTDDTIAAIARAVGYRDPFAFSVAFKRARGASPSNWRREKSG